MSKLVAEYLQHPLSASANIALLDDGNVGGVLGATLGSKLDVAGGKILQIVSVAKTDTFSESVATGGVSGDAISASITPSLATSKVLVLIQGTVSSGAGSGIHLYLFRAGSVSDYRGDAATSRVRTSTSTAGGGVSTATAFQGVIAYLDSPNTASAVTYSMRLGHSSVSTQTVSLNRSSTDTNDSTFARGASSITLMEVSA